MSTDVPVAVYVLIMLTILVRPSVPVAAYALIIRISFVIVAVAIAANALTNSGTLTRVTVPVAEGVNVSEKIVGGFHPRYIVGGSSVGDGQR